MLRTTKLWQNTAISHNFQQKLTQDLRRKDDYLPQMSSKDRHSVYFVKMTLQI